MFKKKIAAITLRQFLKAMPATKRRLLMATVAGGGALAAAKGSGMRWRVQQTGVAEKPPHEPISAKEKVKFFLGYPNYHIRAGAKIAVHGQGEQKHKQYAAGIRAQLGKRHYFLRYFKQPGMPPIIKKGRGRNGNGNGILGRNGNGIKGNESL